MGDFMKNTLKIVSLALTLVSLNAFAQEDRMIANLDIQIQKEMTRVAPGDVEIVSGIVQEPEVSEEEQVEAAEAEAE